MFKAQTMFKAQAMFKAQTMFKASIRLTSLALATLLIAACTNSSIIRTGDTGAELNKQSPVEYPLMSVEQCADAGGEVIGDIGNGNVHRPDYLCNNGTTPIGTIVTTQGEPMMTEGAVCCGP